MARNKYTGRTIRNVEKRMTTVFPAMVFCETCKCYMAVSCCHEVTPPSKESFKRFFDLWMQDKGIQGVAIPDFIIHNNQLC